MIEHLGASGLGRRTAVVSVAKGLVPPQGLPPTTVLSARLGPDRVACVGGPAHAQEMVHAGAALVAASRRGGAGAVARPGVHARGRRVRAVQRPGRRRAGRRRQERGRARRRGHRGPGSERRGRGRRAHLRRGVALRRGAGRAAGVDDRPGRRGRPGGHGAGAARAATVAPASCSRQGCPRRRSPRGSARRSRRWSRCRCWRSALEGAGVGAPVTSALGRLISGELPLDDWVALVRATVPPPALWRRRPNPGFWRRLVAPAVGRIEQASRRGSSVSCTPGRWAIGSFAGVVGIARWKRRAGKRRVCLS